MVSIIKQVAKQYPNNISVSSAKGGETSYKALLRQGEKLNTILTKQKAQKIKKLSTEGPSYYRQQRVGVLCQPNEMFVQSIWGTWMSDGIAVPLGLPHPTKLLEYQIQKVGIDTIIVDPQNLDKITELKKGLDRQLDVHITEEIFQHNDQNALEQQVSEQGTLEEEPVSLQYSNYPEDQGSLILFTSGTTGPPKGLIHTQRSLVAQIQSLAQAWDFTSNDRLLNCLPQHHIHGFVNGSILPLSVGGTVEYMQYTPRKIFQAIQSGRITTFTAVPSMYVNMIDYYNKHLSDNEKSIFREAARNVRLWMCGSAPCPISVLETWKQISGNFPLERYGMTETGMTLSNPLKGERRKNYVGFALPLVEAKIQKDSTEDQKDADVQQGELLIKSPTLFSEYWEDEKATKEAFTEDGYFQTGDVAALDGDPPMYKIQGRSSADIIKSYGYKISALDIENTVRAHSLVKDCIVLGVPDRVQGEVILVLIEPNQSTLQNIQNQEQETFKELDEYLQNDDRFTIKANVDLQDGQLKLYSDGETSQQIRSDLMNSLASYQIPRHYYYCPQIPRNAMGKVNKKMIKLQIQDLI